MQCCFIKCFCSCRKHLDRLARNAAALLGSEVQPELLSQRVYNLCFSALQHLMPCDTDCMLTVLVPTSNRSTLASLYLHVKRLDSKVSGKATSACNVALVGHARNQPWIKDSEWVHERQPIEAIKPDGCAEAILSINAQGETLLEGLTCNFFIVQYNSCINGYELHTAPVSIRSESTGVLDGTIRSTIVQNARPWLDIPVVERAPRASEAQYWEEVFITSAIRIVSPVERVTLLHSHQSETHKQEDLWVASVGCYNKESSHIQHFYANKLKSMLFHYQDDDAVISIDKPKSFSE